MSIASRLAQANAAMQAADTRNLPWLPPGTDTTWICPSGHINPRTTTTCERCTK